MTYDIQWNQCCPMKESHLLCHLLFAISVKQEEIPRKNGLCHFRFVNVSYYRLSRKWKKKMKKGRLHSHWSKSESQQSTNNEATHTSVHVVIGAHLRQRHPFLTFPRGNFSRKLGVLFVSPSTNSGGSLTTRISSPLYWAAMRILNARKLLGYVYRVYKSKARLPINLIARGKQD